MSWLFSFLFFSNKLTDNKIVTCVNKNIDKQTDIFVKKKWVLSTNYLHFINIEVDIIYIIGKLY